MRERNVLATIWAKQLAKRILQLVKVKTQDVRKLILIPALVRVRAQG
jgi:hypothetical protein